MSTNLITRPEVPSWSRWRWGRAAQNRDQGEMSWEVRGIKWEVLQVRGLWGPGSSSCFPPSNHCSSSSHPGEQWATSTLELPCRCVVPQGRTVLRSFQSRPPQVQPRKMGNGTFSQHVSKAWAGGAQIYSPREPDRPNPIGATLWSQGKSLSGDGVTSPLPTPLPGQTWLTWPLTLPPPYTHIHTQRTQTHHPFQNIRLHSATPMNKDIPPITLTKNRFLVC